MISRIHRNSFPNSSNKFNYASKDNRSCMFPQQTTQDGSFSFHFSVHLFSFFKYKNVHFSYKKKVSSQDSGE